MGSGVTRTGLRKLGKLGKLGKALGERQGGLGEWGYGDWVEETIGKLGKLGQTLRKAGRDSGIAANGPMKRCEDTE